MIVAACMVWPMMSPTVTASAGSAAAGPGEQDRVVPVAADPFPGVGGDVAGGQLQAVDRGSALSMAFCISCTTLIRCCRIRGPLQGLRGVAGDGRDDGQLLRVRHPGPVPAQLDRAQRTVRAQQRDADQRVQPVPA